MADILIRGMEMPQECRSCPFHHETYLRTRHICLANKNEEIEHWDIVDPFCPLLPLPEGHGRLGDLETAEAILHNKAFDLAGTSAEYNALNWALRQIKALPTIIEADLEWKMNNCCCFSNTDQAEGGGEDGN